MTESRQVEEKLKLRLNHPLQEVLSLGEETVALFQGFVEADNAAGVLMGISKELINGLQLPQLSLNSIVHVKGQIVELKEKAATKESRAVAAEAKCKLLEETNRKLDEELPYPEGRVTRKAIARAVAAIDASQEKKSFLCSSISDMELLVEDLKSKLLMKMTGLEPGRN
ncbi:hypothetical protein Ancab_006493 [Ancistrocladus abbreviatus]